MFALVFSRAGHFLCPSVMFQCPVHGWSKQAGNTFKVMLWKWLDVGFCTVNRRSKLTPRLHVCWFPNNEISEWTVLKICKEAMYTEHAMAWKVIGCSKYTGTVVSTHVFTFKWLILIILVVSTATLYCIESFSSSSLNPCVHLKAAGHLWFEKWRPGVRWHYAWPLTVFILIKSHTSGTGCYESASHNPTHTKMVVFHSVYLCRRIWIIAAS